MPRKLIALFALISLALLGACGGSDDGDADTSDDASETTSAADGDTLTKEEFIQEGDVICAGLELAGESVEPPADETGFAAYLTELVGQAEAAREDFAELVPPADGEDVHQALLDAFDTSLETVRGAITAAESGDTVTAEDLLTQASEEGDAANDEAQEYGFSECGDDDSTEDSDPAGSSVEEGSEGGDESTEDTEPTE